MPHSEDDQSPPQTFGVSSIRRRWRLVGLCGTISLLIALAFVTNRPATYTASTQLLVYTKELQPGPEYIISPRPADLAQVQNEIEIIKSRGTLMKVIRALNLTDDDEFVPISTPFSQILVNWLAHAPNVATDKAGIKADRALKKLQSSLSVQRVGTSHTILISVTASYPYKAALIANEIASIGPQERVSPDSEAFRTVLLRERLQGLGPAAYVMSAADAPSRPNGPRKIVIMLAAMILGIGVGAALAILLDFKDHTIRSADQVQHLGVECIGAIPRLPLPRLRTVAKESRRSFVKGGGDFDDWVIDHPQTLFSQTLRRVSAVIRSSDLRTVGITSFAQDEGATTLAVNLAHLIARSGKKALFVNAAEGPLTSAAASVRSVSTDTFKNVASFAQNLIIDDRSGLHALSSAAFALEGGTGWLTHMTNNTSEAISLYDVVIVNLPAISTTPEMRAAAQNLHGLLLVLKWGHVEPEKIQRAIDLSGVPRSKFIGAVLNMVNERSIGGYGDKLWKAEASVAARRQPVALSMG